jgi:DNA-directed RNA polymerase subunit L
MKPIIGKKTVELLIPNIEDEFPLVEAKVSVDISGIPCGIANTLRRVIMTDITGYSIQAGEIKTNDRYIIQEFLRDRIASIPLRHIEKPENIILSLEVENKTSKPMMITTDMISTTEKMPLFNKFELIELEPHHRLSIPKMTIKTGTAATNAAKFRKCVLPVSTVLNIKEFSPEIQGFIEPKEHKEKEKEMAKKETASNLLESPYASGFMVSTFVAKPRAFKLTYFAQAIPVKRKDLAILPLIESCKVIEGWTDAMLAKLPQTLEFGKEISTGDVHCRIDIVKEEYEKLVIIYEGRTHTEGNCIVSVINFADDKKINAEYVYSELKKTVKFTILGTGTFALFKKALRDIKGIFGAIEAALRL